MTEMHTQGDGTMARLNADDFFMGLFAALALRGYATISLRNARFDKAVEGVFQQLESVSERERLDLLFRIRVNPIHGDSPTVRRALSSAAQKGIIDLDSPEAQDIRLTLGRSDAAAVLQDITGGERLYEHLADEFLHRYDLVLA